MHDDKRKYDKICRGLDMSMLPYMNTSEWERINIVIETRNYFDASEQYYKPAYIRASIHLHHVNETGGRMLWAYS